LRAQCLAVQRELGVGLALAVGSGQIGSVVDKLGGIDEGLEPMALP
jgi:hypothetical protein